MATSQGDAVLNECRVAVQANAVTVLQGLIRCTGHGRLNVVTQLGKTHHPILEEVVVSMSKSQMKVSRNLNTLVNLAGGDRFSKMYAFTVVQDENKAGDKFFNWKVQPKGFVSKPMYERAEKTYEAVSSGLRKVARDVPAEKHVDQSTGQGDAADDFVPNFG